MFRDRDSKHIKPKKRLGQNFLANKGIVSKIIKSARLNADDIVLEIGPGPGALTFELARACQKVIAVEKDRELADLLREKLTQENISNVEIITDDILEFLSTRYSLLATRYSVVANIPYYLTSALIRRLLELPNMPENIFLTIQKEVAQRICALDGKESLLSLSVKFYADPKIHFYISRGSFTPPPKVDSAFIEITPKKSPPPVAPERFFAVLKSGFSSPRKKLLSNLTHHLPACLEVELLNIKKTQRTNKETIKSNLFKIFERLNIPPNTRPEQLSLQQWIHLAQCLESRSLNIR